MKREKEHFARFMHTSKDYARKNGFKGTFLIEPKPMEAGKLSMEDLRAYAIETGEPEQISGRQEYLEYREQVYLLIRAYISL